MARMSVLTVGISAIVTSVLAVAAAFGSGPARAVSHTPGPRAGAASGRASVTFQPLSLENGWKSGIGGAPRVGISNGVVYLAGSVQQTGTGSNEFAVLPDNYWPGIELYMPVFTSGGAQGVLAIHGDGRMDVVGGHRTAYSSLAGLSFPLTLKSSKLTLLNGWKTAPGTAAPSVSLSNGVVYLSGAISAGTQVLVTTLPAADRPAHSLFMPVSMAGGTEGSLAIDTQGHVYVMGNGATAMTSLEGIHYPLGS